MKLKDLKRGDVYLYDYINGGKAYSFIAICNGCTKSEIAFDDIILLTKNSDDIKCETNCNVSFDKENKGQDDFKIHKVLFNHEPNMLINKIKREHPELFL